MNYGIVKEGVRLESSQIFGLEYVTIELRVNIMVLMYFQRISLFISVYSGCLKSSGWLRQFKIFLNFGFTYFKMLPKIKKSYFTESQCDNLQSILNLMYNQQVCGNFLKCTSDVHYHSLREYKLHTSGLQDSMVSLVKLELTVRNIRSKPLHPAVNCFNWSAYHKWQARYFMLII